MKTNIKSINMYKRRIYNLKQLLKSTDYKAIKFAEGELTISEYAPIKEQRKQYRAEINALEAQINALEVK